MFVIVGTGAPLSFFGRARAFFSSPRAAALLVSADRERGGHEWPS